jgi:carbon-monoxide dehydrogenase large subunit/6-hydroxypseudooxynicotine dehydrogenase subunit gamma
VTVTASGEAHVFSGGTSLGQVIQTVLAQIAADALGVDPGTVRVIAGDTAAQPFGAGSWASRSTVVGGSAVHQAATAVRERVQLVARMTCPYGVHAAVVDVDTQTGQVRVLRYLVAYEVGRAINPMLVEGQLRGGVAQGIGGALCEEFSYDGDGQLQAITFIEYRMSTAAEIPPVDVLLAQDAPSPGNPLGVIGAGEGGVNAVGAAVANAVRDALGLAGGVGQLPLTPARVRALAGRCGGAE